MVHVSWILLSQQQNAKLTISNSKCTCTDTETKPNKPNYTLFWRQWQFWKDNIPLKSKCECTRRICFWVHVKTDIYFFPQEGNSPAASQRVTVLHSRVPSFITDKSLTWWQHFDAARVYSAFWSTPHDKRLLILTESISKWQSKYLLLFSSKKTMHIRNWSSISVTITSGNNITVTVLQKYVSLSWAPHRVNCKMLIKGITVSYHFSLSKTLLNCSIFAKWSLQITQNHTEW